MLTADEKQMLLRADTITVTDMAQAGMLEACESLATLGFMVAGAEFVTPARRLPGFAITPAGREAARRLRAEPPPHGAFTVLMRELAATRKPNELPREIVWHVNEADFRPFDHSGEAIPEGWTCWVFANGDFWNEAHEVRGEAAGRTGEECLRRVVKLVQGGR